jgi:hypothetical protein
MSCMGRPHPNLVILSLTQDLEPDVGQQLRTANSWNACF